MKPKRTKHIPSARSNAPGTSSPSPKNGQNPQAVFGICVFLATITFVVYGQTLGYGFQPYDDPEFVYENAVVTAGLTWHGIAWAFSHYVASNWVPLTMISHMLDCQFYHLDAGQHHLTNVLLHTASVILLFLVLRQMTGALWRSAFVAAVFAIHPLHVESVAWVAERRDVLSGFFFMLTLWAYTRYVRARRPESVRAYWLVMLFFTFGLMSKPILVTLPLILLLLDYWPLKRVASSSNLRPLLVEKIPLGAVSFLFCILTLLSQRHAIQPLKDIPISAHLENALVSYAIYLGQLFYPANLSAFYPYPANGFPVSETIGALALLAGISLWSIYLRRERPYFFVGWFWFLIMLVPVIGIVQAGSQAHADRYTYLSQIGLYLLIAWLAAALCQGWRLRRAILGAAALLVVVALAATAKTQTAYWHDGESLWRHALACTRSNSVAENNLGIVLGQKGEMDKAQVCFQKALAISPSYADAYNNLGNVFLAQGQWDEAVVYYQKAAEFNPQNAAIDDHLGLAFLQKGEMDQAAVYFQKALEVDPSYADADYNLGNVFLARGQTEQATAYLQKAVQLNPRNAAMNDHLGLAFLQIEEMDKAISQFKLAMSLDPNYAPAADHLRFALEQTGPDVNQNPAAPTNLPAQSP